MDDLGLTSKTCTPCQGGIPPLTPQEAEHFRSNVPDWELLDNTTKVKRTFRTRNFMDAMGLARQVGELCEAEGHHADITFGWGYCKVVFQTHKINGLHENDFIMAAKVDQLASQGAAGTMQKIKEEVE
ncbi:4a-hydroxytetrahydrobiopterin dehydratase [Novimethylophilus kurashikiensis]|uniref:Putative pterin-4-alpha-carbinolamine dehydratase n=1 Tax=Novimethylophilus kurashikiensis TaxID=1825523 RepID=A0A2R5F7M2_9PROT|nr:4a-hydroxytetrahydrobiopterin dehydratase [Novimethylophilus kurashikiensis]GBG12681.1 4a-hydroxytetrahydrobiopterin dehydratase [Novimethylophilus kurashikiensis]